MEKQLKTYTENQTNWIFQNIKKITDKYMKDFPETQEDWNHLCEDMRNIVDRSQDDPLTQELCLVMLEYFDKLYKQKKN